MTAALDTEVVGVGAHMIDRWVLRPMGGRGWGGVYWSARSVKIRSRIAWEVDDLGEVKLAGDVVDVQAVKVSADNQLGRWIPHPQLIRSVDYVFHEDLSGGGTWRVIHHAYND